MLARLPTTLNEIARAMIGLVFLVAVQALGPRSVSPVQVAAQNAPPPVVVGTVLPDRFINRIPLQPEQSVRPAPFITEQADRNFGRREQDRREEGPVRSAAPLQLERPEAQSPIRSPGGSPVASSIAPQVIVVPVPGFDLSAMGQQPPAVRPALPMQFVLDDPARTRTKSIEKLPLASVTNPTAESTVVQARPPAATMEFLRLSTPAGSLAPAAGDGSPIESGQARKTAGNDGLLEPPAPIRNRSTDQAPSRMLMPDYVMQSIPPGTTSPAQRQPSREKPPAAASQSAMSLFESGPLGIDVGLSERPAATRAGEKPTSPADIAQSETIGVTENLLRLSDSAVDASQEASLVEQFGPPAVTRPPVAAVTRPPVAADGLLPEPKRQARPTEGIADGTPKIDGIQMLQLSDGATQQRRTAENRVTPPEVIPTGFEPWWQSAVMKRLRESPKSVNVDVNSLIVDALRYSAQVQAISDEAIIAQTSITRAAAEFDSEVFMETRMVRTDVPTGSELEAGAGQSRLREMDWQYSAGLRKKNEHGGRFEIAQRVGTKNSTSEFFSPERQGNSRLTLSYNQPLLNGGGEVYNSSLILMAKIDTTIALDRTSLQLQDQLLEVTESMWELYIQRSLMLQKRRHLERATAIHTRLVRRRGIDVLESQVARAGAAVARRRTELIRAETAVRNAEAFLRALVNSPELLSNRSSELVPVQPPASYFVPVDLHDALATALNNRPDIDAAAQEIEAARIRLKVARNELRPVLDAVLETYVSGIRGGYNMSGSISDQFGIGNPSYTAGLVFENPIHRRSANANHLRRRVELRQLSNKFKATVETLNADVEVAVREVETAFREMQATYQSMTAAQSDADYLQRRWESLPGDDRSASFMLEDLLDAQDRLSSAEFEFTRSQVAYTMSLTYMNRATGTLLKHEKINMVHDVDRGLPTIRFEKADEDSRLPAPNVADRPRPLQDPGPVQRRQ
jgi:outer membrane protein TolC